jgi:hypothetical protein
MTRRHPSARVRQSAARTPPYPRRAIAAPWPGATAECKGGLAQRLSFSSCPPSAAAMEGSAALPFMPLRQLHDDFELHAAASPAARAPPSAHGTERPCCEPVPCLSHVPPHAPVWAVCRAPRRCGDAIAACGRDGTSYTTPTDPSYGHHRTAPTGGRQHPNVPAASRDEGFKPYMATWELFYCSADRQARCN